MESQLLKDPAALDALPAMLALAHRARFALILIFVLALGGGPAYALLAPKTYRAKVVLSVVAQDGGGLGALLGQFGGLASLAGMGGLSVGKSSSAEPIAVLSSREFARGFIQENGLLPDLFREKWDPVGKRWKVKKASEEPTLEAGVKKFVERVRSVEVDELGGLVTLTVDWMDRETAAKWANAMVARVNRELRQRAISESQNSINYLNAEAAKTNVQPLLDAIYRVVETQVKSIMLAKVRDDYAFKVIDPAVASDRDRHVWPRGSLVMGLSLLVAMLFSILSILAVYLLDRFRRGYKESIGLRD
ncbi:MAG: hypothetical protein IPM70_07795 [Proteobacteria bacterium]|nr:hypothetical protein [Pseudomonadota bacterium]